MQVHLHERWHGCPQKLVRLVEYDLGLPVLRDSLGLIPGSLLRELIPGSLLRELIPGSLLRVTHPLMCLVGDEPTTNQNRKREDGIFFFI